MRNLQTSLRRISTSRQFLPVSMKARKVWQFRKLHYTKYVPYFFKLSYVLLGIHRRFHQINCSLPW